MDENFWKRADAYIQLANEQSDLANRGEVNASFTYACARFNAFKIHVFAYAYKGINCEHLSQFKEFSIFSADLSI